MRKEMVLAIGVAIGILEGSGAMWVIMTRNSAPITAPPLIAAAAPLPTAPLEIDTHAEFTHDNILIRLNEARLAKGLRQLYDDQYLSREAQKDLDNNCPVTSHDNFRKLYAKGEFKRYDHVAEVLDSGEATPKEAIKALLASPTHADIITGNDNEWTYAGIGFIAGPVNCVSIITGK